MYHNIEKSAFVRGRYIGYAHGVWHITKGGIGWRARHIRVAPPPFLPFERQTLRDISTELERIEKETAPCEPTTR